MANESKELELLPQRISARKAEVDEMLNFPRGSSVDSDQGSGYGHLVDDVVIDK